MQKYLKTNNFIDMRYAILQRNLMNRIHAIIDIHLHLSEYIKLIRFNVIKLIWRGNYVPLKDSCQI